MMNKKPTVARDDQLFDRTLLFESAKSFFVLNLIFTKVNSDLGLTIINYN